MLALIKAPGSPAVRCNLPDDERAQLAAMQQYVDGYIEIAVKARDFTVWCNEEGLLHALPRNFHRPQDGQPIVGTVVVTGPLVRSRDGYVTTAIEDAVAVRVIALLEAWVAAGQSCGCDPAHYDPQTTADHEHATASAELRRAQEGHVL